jgi:hypothetical protein
MALINLRFTPEAEELILQGKKCCTVLDEINGTVGDLFRIETRLYRIVEIVECPYLFIVKKFFKINGYASSDDYLFDVRRIFNDSAPGDLMYIHFFAYVGEVE